jgi:hypothetical protein
MMTIRIRKGYFAPAALLGAAISVVGCAGDLPSTFTNNNSSGSGSGTNSSGSGSSSSGASCADVPTVTFPMSCGMGNVTCHIANASPIGATFGLDLVSPNVASRLVGVKSHEPAMAMVPPGTLLIDPANPMKSAIYTKLLDPPPYASRMPFIPPYLDPSVEACILQWVMTTAASAPPANTFGSDASTPTTDAGMGGATNGG